MSSELPYDFDLCWDVKTEAQLIQLIADTEELREQSSIFTCIRAWDLMKGDIKDAVDRRICSNPKVPSVPNYHAIALNNARVIESFIVLNENKRKKILELEARVKELEEEIEDMQMNAAGEDI